MASSYSFLLISAFLVGFSLFDVTIASDGRKTLSIDTETIGVKDVFLPIDPKDPKVVELARYAIDEYKRLKRVVVTYKQVLYAGSRSDKQGRTYEIFIEATDAAGVVGDYSATILVSKNGTRKLLSIAKKS